MTWLLVSITLIFSAVGALIMGMGFSMNPFSGTDLAKRALELKLLGAFFMISPWISILFLRLRTRRQTRFREEILKYGTRKKAVLIDFHETGTYVNEDPRVHMVIQVEESDGEHGIKEFTGIVPVLRAVGIRPGMEIEITESRSGMIIHWSGND